MKIFTLPKALLTCAALTASLCAQAQAITNTKADQLDYSKEISQDEYNAAYEALRVQIGQAQTALYGLRGGKEGGLPESHAYQMEFSLGPDNYAQYSCVTHSDFQYSNATLRSTYDLCKPFIGNPGSGYSYVRQGLAPILNSDQINSIPEMKAAYLLLYDYAAIENADLFGALPYVDFKNNRTESPFTYNDMKTVYYSVAANIDQIVKVFDNFANRPDWYKSQLNARFKRDLPLVYNCDYTKRGMDVWKRFANSLKLRMAIHISSVEPATAKQWAESAVTSGVIETIDDQIAFYCMQMGFANPIYQIWNEWNDNRISASFESLMMSLDHPYSKYLFQPNSDPIAKTGSQGSAPAATPADTRIVGMRCGTVPGIGQGVATNSYVAFSTFDQAYLSELDVPCYLMKLAEVQFNRAEGAIRGWDMGGTAQSFYEQGIRNAYLEDPENAKYDGKYNDYVDDYMNKTTANDYTYVDPTGQTPDMPSVTKIGVKWDESLSLEKKLEMIITQKYFAEFPYSYEPWVDLRRTGYPKMFPVLNVSDGDGSLKDGDQMRRIPWVSDDPSTIADLTATGVHALGGPDQMATRLWWDTGVNFPDAQGISSVKGDKSATGDGVRYNLAGQRVGKDYKGVVICNGRKFLAK